MEGRMSLFVDLTAAPYLVVANDGSKAAQNTAAINSAIVDYSGTRARLVLPQGDIYLEQANPGAPATKRAWSLRFGPGVSCLSLAGQGQHATRLVQAGVGTSGQWDGIVVDGASKIKLSEFSIEQGTITNRDIGDHHALMGIYAGFGVNTSDITVESVYFGPCIGDAFRVGAASGDVNYIAELRLLDFTMRTQGHPQGAGGLRLGSRSGVSFQRGFQNVEVGSGYIEGAKNSPFEMEPSGVGRLDNLIVHDLIINNVLGQTHAAVAFSGLSTNRLTRSQMHNVIILQGSLLVQNTLNTVLDEVTIYSSGAGPMAGSSQALLQVSQPNTSPTLHNVNIVRDSGSTAGPLATIITGVSDTTKRLNIDGGVRRSAVGAGYGLAYVDLQAPIKPTIRALRLQLDSTAGTEYGIKFRSNGFDISEPTIADVAIEATTKLAAGIWFAATNGKSITNIDVTNLRAPNSVTTGVLFDVNSGVTIDSNPVLQGCDLSGATNAWLAQNSAIGVVFPVIAGNRGGIGTIVGTVAPEGLVTATPGCFYIRQHGNSTALHFKSIGTSNTGWTQVTIP
jgi:hypothetical protein